MKKFNTTTTGIFTSQHILNHCGDYAGSFQDKAYDIFQKLWDSEINAWDGNIWMDIMYDQNGKVYAIWAEDSLTCQNAWLSYVELSYEDCPEAFEGMDETK